MRWLSRNLLDTVFDGDKGEAFSVILVGLLIAGAIVLVVNLTARPRKPQAPKPAWEPVPDDEEPPVAPAAAPPPATPAKPAPKPASKPAPARRKA